MKKTLLIPLIIILYSCTNNSDKIEIVKNELNKVYTDNKMTDNLDYKVGEIKDKDSYYLLHKYYFDDYFSGLQDGVDIQESKKIADKFEMLEKKSDGKKVITTVRFTRVIEKDTVLDGTYYLDGNIVLGDILKISN